MVNNAHFKRPKNILAIELDSTLLGSRQALADFNLYMTKNTKNFALVYITDRVFSKAWRLITEENLFFPDVLITSMGTEIYMAPRFRPSQGWVNKMLLTWDSGKIQSVIEEAVGLLQQNIHSRYHLAYRAETAHFDDTLLKIREAVEAVRLPVEVVTSADQAIFIIPKGTGKVPALCYVQEFYSVKPEQTFVFSGVNDDNIFSKGNKVIVVGKTQSTSKNTIKFNPKEVYYTKAYYASGILEGLKKHGFV